MEEKRNKLIFTSIIGCAFLVICIIVGLGIKQLVKPATLEDLTKRIKVVENTPTKAAIQMDNSTLYDELPEITKYPLEVEGKGQIDLEIFTSGEKAGTNHDSWLIDCATQFNKENYTTNSGQTISMSVRSVSSGLAADYIISEKYLPDLYTPSNELFGQYAIENSGDIELYCNRLVGNTAGILISKGSSDKTIASIIDGVRNGKLNIGYTNPQTSATGLNLLIEILKIYGKTDITNEDAVLAFSEFNQNIPFVAYTTQQMVHSAGTGTLDGMVTEYQAYINDQNLVSNYDFIPFGVRHDNPLYIVNKDSKTKEELEAIEIITDYLTNPESQALATKYGFNQNNDYQNSYELRNTEVSKALSIYKENKDSGKDIIAVFVADCSGSMDGAPLMELQNSLTNGMKYINSNNYIGFVSYNSKVTVELPIAKFDFNQKSYFQGAINHLSAHGSTYSYEAVCVALDMIEKEKVNHPDAKCMVFLLSDGYANGNYSISMIKQAVVDTEIPIYTIGYTDAADTKALTELSNINEAATINADSDDIVYKIKSLFNAQL